MSPAPHRIVFANEKGGTGKSTTAVHVAVALAYQGAKVAAIDLVRCLLLRGTPVPEVRAVMTEVVGPVDPEVGFDLLRFDLEIAERKLELALRRVLADTLVSQSTLELLSLHYLRLQPRLKELEELSRRPAPAYAGLPRTVSSSLH